MCMSDIWMGCLSFSFNWNAMHLLQAWLCYVHIGVDEAADALDGGVTEHYLAAQHQWRGTPSTVATNTSLYGWSVRSFHHKHNIDYTPHWTTDCQSILLCVGDKVGKGRRVCFGWVGLLCGNHNHGVWWTRTQVCRWSVRSFHLSNLYKSSPWSSPSCVLRSALLWVLFERVVQ